MVKKPTKLGSEIFILLKIDEVKTKCGVRQIITIICHICAKELSDSNFN